MTCSNQDWGSKPPTEPGWYWWDDLIYPDHTDIEPRYIYLSPAGLMTGNDEVDLHVSPPEDIGGEWWPERINAPA